MWRAIEQNIDGMVGRMVSWLMQPPVRHVGGPPRPAEEAAALEPVGEKPVAEEAATEKPGKGEPAAEVEAAASDTAQAADVPDTEAEVVGETVSEESEAARVPAEEADDDLEEQDRKIIDALAADDPDAGASMKDLTGRTGETAYAVRQRLKRLIAAGLVQRKGKGMRTRYHRVESR